MQRSPAQFPQPSDPDARYDAIVARGEQIRRRDRRTQRLVTGGAVAAVVLAVLAVVALSAGRGDDRSPATRADRSTSTTSTVPDRLTATSHTDGRVVDVVVDDPHFPVGSTSQLCVRVRVQPEGPATVATAAQETCWGAADGAADTTAEIPLVSAEVGCGATSSRSDDPTTTTAAPATEVVRHRFRLTLPAELPAGRYVAEITAVSSATDGCETSAPDDHDVTATSKVAFEHR